MRFNQTEIEKIYTKYFSHVNNKRATRGAGIIEKLAAHYGVSRPTLSALISKETLRRVTILKAKTEVLDQIRDGVPEQEIRKSLLDLRDNQDES